MEVDSPTQHSPIHVDVQSHYRVTFDNMKYYPVKKHWEIAVKLEDKKEEHLLGETNILWPHTDPPHSIIYDSENSLLQWENNESLAYLPIRIPSRPVYDISSVSETRVNPKILIRPSLSDSGDRSSAKIQRESPWKELVTSKKFLKASVSELRDITHKFNPLFEERLTAKQQHDALFLINKHFQSKNVCRLFYLLLDMRFFDLSSLNSFIAKYAVGTSSVYSLSRADDSASTTVASGKPQLNGTPDAENLTEHDKVKTKKSPKGLLSSILYHPQFVLSDNAFVPLLRRCALQEASFLRKAIIDKSMPLDDALRRRIFSELQNDVIVQLLEVFVAEYLIRKRTKPEVLGKVLDLLLFITNGFNDKLLWDCSDDLRERLSTVCLALKASAQISLSLTKVMSTQHFRSAIGPMPPPQTDYRRRRIKFRRLIVGLASKNSTNQLDKSEMETDQ